MRNADDFGQDIVNRITVERLLQDLTEEEREILYLWIEEGWTFAEIGVDIAQRYREKDRLSSSGIRYLRDQILRKLRNRLEIDGIRSSRD